VRDLPRDAEKIKVILEDLASEGFLKREGGGNYALNTTMLLELRARLLKRAPFKSRRLLMDFVAENVGDILKTAKFFDGVTPKQKEEICLMLAYVSLNKIDDIGRVGMYL